MSREADDRASSIPQLLGRASCLSQKPSWVKNRPPVVGSSLDSCHLRGEGSLVCMEPILRITTSLRVSQLEARWFDPQQLVRRPGLQELVLEIGEVRKPTLENLEVRGCYPADLLASDRVRGRNVTSPHRIPLKAGHVHSLFQHILNLSLQHFAREAYKHTGMTGLYFL